MTAKSQRRPQEGFTLIETMIAIAVLSFGVLALVAVFTQGISYVATSQMDLVAKEKAAEAVETVFTARDKQVLTWAQIRNVSDGGVFLDAPQPLVDPGPDGLVGTGDDDASKPDAIVLPGPDNTLGTADDEVVPLSSFTREIKVRDVSPNLREVQIIIRYSVGRFNRQYVLVTQISSFA